MGNNTQCVAAIHDCRAVETSREGVAEPSISPAAHELPMSDSGRGWCAAGVSLFNLDPALISDSPSTRPSTHSRFGPAITFGVSPAAAVCWPRTRARCEQDGSKEGRRRARQPGRHRPPTAGPFSSMPGPRAPCSTLLSQAASGIAAEQLMALQPARRPQQQRHIWRQRPTAATAAAAAANNPLSPYLRACLSSRRPRTSWWRTRPLG